MDESILDSVKRAVGLDTTDEVFDGELIMYINLVFTILNQIGVGPTDSYTITDSNDVWSDFSSDSSVVMLVKTYMYIKVRLLFDPPTSSFLATALQDQATEYEWRLNILVDKYPEDERKEDIEDD